MRIWPIIRVSLANIDLSLICTTAKPRVLTSTFCIFPMLQHTYNNFLVRSYRSNAPVYASILITYLPVPGVVKPIRGASGLIFFNSTNLTPRTILGTKRGSGERRNNQMVEKTSFVSAWDGKMAEAKVLLANGTKILLIITLWKILNREMTLFAFHWRIWSEERYENCLKNVETRVSGFTKKWD